jgi:hypothetical protein
MNRAWVKLELRRQVRCEAGASQRGEILLGNFGATAADASSAKSPGIIRNWASPEEFVQ